jgi:hypothetical protein
MACVWLLFDEAPLVASFPMAHVVVWQLGDIVIWSGQARIFPLSVHIPKVYAGSTVFILVRYDDRGVGGV